MQHLVPYNIVSNVFFIWYNRDYYSKKYFFNLLNKAKERKQFFDFTYTRGWDLLWTLGWNRIATLKLQMAICTWGCGIMIPELDCILHPVTKRNFLVKFAKLFIYCRLSVSQFCYLIVNPLIFICNSNTVGRHPSYLSMMLGC